MEKQHQIEKERMKKRRNSQELEKVELTTTGRLLVNAGWFFMDFSGPVQVQTSRQRFLRALYVAVDPFPCFFFLQILKGALAL